MPDKATADYKLKLAKLKQQEEQLLKEYELLLKQEEYEQCESSFYQFFRSSWEYIDNVPYKDNWHIECICEHAQAAIERKIKKLLVTIPPRHSKCIDKFSITLLSDGSTKYIKDLKPGDKVLSSDGYGLKEDTVKAVINSGTKPLYKITLVGGIEIKATADHRLYGWDEWVQVKDLKVGDPLCIAEHIPNLTEQTSDLTKEDAFLLALWLAEGSKNHHGYMFITPDKETINKAIEIATAKGWSYTKHRTIEHSLHCNGIHKQENFERPIDFLKRFGLFKTKTTYNLTVPKEVYTAPIDVIHEFVSTYISCDGCVELNKEEETESIRIMSASESMIRDLQILFRRLGIDSKINSGSQMFYGVGEYKKDKPKKLTYWRLS